MTVDATTIRFFEAVAELESVKQRDATSIEADFTQAVVDTVSTRSMRLESLKDGQVLVLNDLDEGGAPGPQRHARCPQ